MVLAVGTGRALPKANRPRGGGVSSAKAEGYPASRHGDFPLRRGVMFISPAVQVKVKKAALISGPATLKFTAGGRKLGKNSATPRQNPWVETPFYVAIDEPIDKK